MTALTEDLAFAFRERAALVAAYGRAWWEHDPAVDDLCRRIRGLRLRLYELQRVRGEITTGDVYALVESSRAWPDGWRAERLPTHRAVLGALPQAPGLLGERPASASAYITIGLPGSGKTSALRPIAWNHYRSTLTARDRGRNVAGLPPGAAVLDADEVRVLIPEYSGGLGSSVVQPETAALTYGPRQMALLAAGYSGLLIDTVGDPDTLPATVQRLATAGYQVYVLLARVDVAIAETRAMQRALDTGRVVSLAYLRRKEGQPDQALQAVVASGVALGGWGVWDTTGELTQVAGEGTFGPRPVA